MDPFDAQSLLEAAASQVPGEDFGPRIFEDSYHRLLTGLREEADLTQPGTWAAVSRTIQALKRRRHLSQLLKRHPEIRNIDIQAPVIIVGFPRTGTTLLHNLLAANPQHRAIRLWEMREPFSPEGASEDWAHQTQLVMTKLVQAAYQLSPQLADIHPLHALWPDECSWLFRNSFATLVNAFSYYMPTYARWVMERDMTADYAYYRLQLQAILFQRPGSPLVLKDPCHTWHLAALLRALPDARVIHLHRDICQVASSFSSLCRALQNGMSKGRPKEAIGLYATDMLEAGMHSMLAARRELSQSHFVDLPYSQLVSDPMATVSALHAQLELPWNAEANEAVENWLGEGKRHTGRHRHDLDMFGLNAEKLRDRFAPYLTAFASHLE